MKYFSLLIAALVAFGNYGCGEQPAAQKKTTSVTPPGPAKPTEAAPAPPPPPPAVDAKK